MLLLTRKVGERINIGDDVVISIVEISKGKVRLGIEAPKQMPVHRHEIYARIQEENLKASQATSFFNVAEAAKRFREKNVREQGSR